ncbi:hypothetical protein COY93_03490 [Candidatus Uhrbacteria bacterium CG_4_10_14_0_8_um_filter_58_22]|uniref:Uncharacterized protein n=1 Tax=Candidatus Uhrbacteria bacterium CG_4_10_14_0_8_um_filter_58_22 TaxID=1975029 RepID=A0A2M7Q9E2_9BACT|nr:MAG: hypothetical protein AUJ19_02820 [Parcubacteria group bacterium CG1_02_58_44]PIY62298.1 MAG: hypothetical protein COY93_03490 [Candidatus Uhrbacteria bacterium CG_4_10_14_0_8_um_filter_58_22]
MVWRRIKLDAFVGRAPIDVRHPYLSPGCSLLFLAAQHPGRIRAMQERQSRHLGFWLPGLRCTEPNGSPLASVPFFCFRSEADRLCLSAERADNGDGRDMLTIPQYV